jgi:hypothetical protein
MGNDVRLQIVSKGGINTIVHVTAKEPLSLEDFPLLNETLELKDTSARPPSPCLRLLTAYSCLFELWLGGGTTIHWGDNESRPC